MVKAKREDNLQNTERSHGPAPGMVHDHSELQCASLYLEKPTYRP